MSHDSELNIRAELCQVITPDTGKLFPNPITSSTALLSTLFIG
jgi:hypothetical protein